MQVVEHRAWARCWCSSQRRAESGEICSLTLAGIGHRAWGMGSLLAQRRAERSARSARRHGARCWRSSQRRAESGERREVLTSRADARWLALLAKVFSNQCSVKKRRLVPPLLAALAGIGHRAWGMGSLLTQLAAESGERRAERSARCARTHGARCWRSSQRKA